MANYPDVLETWADEINDDGSDTVGTLVDATDQNRVYALLVALQGTVGLTTDPAAALSHEGRLKAIEAASALTNPMAAVGDTLYSADASGTPAALPIGTTGQVLTVVAGLPAWAAAAGGGMADPMANAGDLIVRDLANVTARLGIGSAGQVLSVVGGVPAWLTPPFIPLPGVTVQGAVLVNDGTAWVNLPPGVAGQVLKTGGPSAPAAWGDVSVSPPGSAIAAPSGSVLGDLLDFDGTNWGNFSPGAAGLFLKSNGPGAALSWALPAGGFTSPMTTLADLIVGLAGGAPGRLGIGSAGQVLTVVSGAPAWAAPAVGFTNPMTTLDDLIIGGASGAAARLGKGSNGQVLTISSSGHVVWQNSASGFADPTTTRGDLLYHAAAGTTRLALGSAGTVLTSDGTDAGWATPSGGGGGAGSRLARTTRGLVLWHDYSQVPDHALGTSADALGYQVAATIDHGTWAFRNGLLVETAGANPADCRNMSVAQLYGVFQTRFYTPAVGTTQGGLEFAIQAGVDTRILYVVRNGDATVWNRTAGGWGSSHSGTAPTGMIQGQWIAAKVRWTATQVLSTWANRVLLDSAFTFTTIPGVGGFGLVAVSAAGTVFKDYAIYTSTILTVAGLSGTQAFRLLDAGGNVLATSAAQSGGTATIDLATVADCPVVGVLEVHTSTAFASLIAGGRYPAEGVAGDLWGGDTYTYT